MPTTIAGKEVGAIGFGMMSFGMKFKSLPPGAPLAVLEKALSLGATAWNGGQFYGPPEGNSLHFLSEYFARHPEHSDKVSITIKGAMNMAIMAPDCSEKGIRDSVDTCLQQLHASGNNAKIDVFECARLDTANHSVEETMGVLKTLRDEGKFAAVGLSEVKAETIRRAHKVVPIASVEVEVSLWATEIFRNGVAATCAELGIPILAYSPLGRGMFAGSLQSADDLSDDDPRKKFHPKFQGEAFETNLKLAREVQSLAKRKGCTTAQISLGWLLALSGKNGNPIMIPIPGTSSEERLEENMKAVPLNDEDVAEIEKILGEHKVVGDRYPAQHMKYLEA